MTNQNLFNITYLIILYSQTIHKLSVISIYNNISILKAGNCNTY